MKCIMELVLFSLFIVAHLAVGGELLQYSTGVVYVSDDGIDDSSCLNGGNHCKTLGYVLTNIPMLQCSNCTVMVTYDHIVGPLNSDLPYYVDISNLRSLYIVGLEQPHLNFNRSGLRLIVSDTDSLPSVFLENISINDCRAEIDTIRYPLCIITESYVAHFIMANVTLHNSAGIYIKAQTMHCLSSGFFNSYNYSPGSQYLTIEPTGSVAANVIVFNSTFQNTTNFNFIILISCPYPLSPPSVTILIEQCHFTNIAPHSTSTKAGVIVGLLAEHMNFITFNVEKCSFDKSSGYMIMTFVGNIFTSLDGTVLIANNHFSNNTCRECISITFSDSGYCSNNLMATCTNNTFVENFANQIISFDNWAHLEIEDSMFRDNTVSGHIVYAKYYFESPLCSPYSYRITIHDSLFLNNSVEFMNHIQYSGSGAVVGLVNSMFLRVSTIIYNLDFTNNNGTPLYLYRVHVIVFGDVVISNNNAVIGGGMFITGSLIAIYHATITFANNVASYGGAICATECFVEEHYPNGSIVFDNNHATYGPVVLSLLNWYDVTNAGCVALQDAANIVSLPTNMSFNSDNTTSVFPGQTIVGDVMAIDCFGNGSFCIADVYLLCDGDICIDYGLNGPSTIFLSDGSVNTGLAVVVNNQSNAKDITLKMACKFLGIDQSVALMINVSLLSCPLGFIFDQFTGQCECANSMDGNFVCSKDVGVSCVRQGYWYSNASGTVSRCAHLFCDYSKYRSGCLPSVSPDFTNYVLLGNSQDDQCLDGHGGTLCTGCVHNKLPTYGALQCIDSDKCAKWHPYVLLFLNFMIPFINGIFLIMFVARIKLSIGSGYLYGPLFYLAVLSLIPLSSYSGTLSTIILSFIATFLLKFHILSYMPWCFIDTSLLTSKWFELIAPSVVAVASLLTVSTFKHCHKLVRLVQQSPLETTRLYIILISVLFWSLASTAISVITPVHLSGVEGARVHLQPDLPYLSGGHIPLWIISVIILLVLYSIVVIFTFPCSHNLIPRLKPLLNEFQSCYKDSHCWYGGVYFIMWTILQAMTITSNYRIFQTFTIGLTVTHGLLQPYEKKWLNIIDGLLLCCLSITSCLVLDDSGAYSSNSMVTKILVYMSVMAPLCLISLGIVSIVLIRLGLVSKLHNVRVHPALKGKLLRLQSQKSVPLSNSTKEADIVYGTRVHSKQETKPMIIYCDFSSSDEDSQ